MTLDSPVFVRELISAARSGTTYRMRAAVGAAGILFMTLVLFSQTSGQESGPQLFSAWENAIMTILFIAAPVLTADAISREKRDGTLDLLFLTTLTATKIVAAKFQAHFFRLLTIWLVLAPLGVVPFLAGGVTVRTVVMSLATQFTVMLVCLSSGMLASAFANRTLPAIVIAILLSSAIFWFDLRLMRYLGMIQPNLFFVPAMFGGNPSAAMFAANGQALMVSYPGLWQMGAAMLHAQTWGGLLWNVSASAFCSYALLRMAAAWITSSRKKADEAPGQAWFREVFLTPRYWTSGFRNSMRRKMEANPLIWLEYRTAWSRSGRWALLGVLVFLESWVLLVLPSDEIYFRLQSFATFSLLVILAVTAASSFLKERESGAFELLLVAPFTEASLLFGRLRAVWSYYWPVGAVLLLFIWLGAALDVRPFFRFQDEEQWMARMASILLSSITIPVAGLYFALRVRYFLPTIAATIFCGLLAPIYLWPFLTQLAWYIDRQAGMYFFTSILNPDSFPYVHATIAVHLLLAFFLCMKTYETLRSRRFAYC